MPFQRGKQMLGIFHLLLNRQDVILLGLCVQVGSKVSRRRCPAFPEESFFAKDNCLSDNQKFSKFAYVLPHLTIIVADLCIDFHLSRSEKSIYFFKYI